MSKKKSFKTKPYITYTLSLILLVLLSILFFTTKQDFTRVKALKSTGQIQGKSLGKPIQTYAGSTSPSPTSTIQPQVSSIQLPASSFQPKSSGRSLTVPILYYHYIGENPNKEDEARDNLSINPKTFDSQLNFITQNGYTPITLDSLYGSLKSGTSLPPKPVILTFDDGYIDFYINAYPAVKKYGFQTTVFIPTGLIGGSYYLTWDQIKEMSSSGLVSFQAHSVSHSMLTELSSDKLRYEVFESKKALEQILGKPVNFFAYPYGVSDPRVWQEVQKAGYLGGLGTWFSKDINEGFIFDMPRIKIPGGISIEDFGKLLVL